MATFLIKKEYKITRQEGDDCDVVLVLPSILPININTNYTFTVTGSIQSSNKVLFKKLNANMTISGLNITIPINAADTKNKVGISRWEFQIETNGKIITVGRGDFEIIKEIIK
jgi:hypothetical protein